MQTRMQPVNMTQLVAVGETDPVFPSQMGAVALGGIALKPTVGTTYTATVLVTANGIDWVILATVTQASTDLAFDVSGYLGVKVALTVDTTITSLDAAVTVQQVHPTA